MRVRGACLCRAAKARSNAHQRHDNTSDAPNQPRLVVFDGCWAPIAIQRRLEAARGNVYIEPFIFVHSPLLHEISNPLCPTALRGAVRVQTGAQRFGARYACVRIDYRRINGACIRRPRICRFGLRRNAQSGADAGCVSAGCDDECKRARSSAIGRVHPRWRMDDRGQGMGAWRHAYAAGTIPTPAAAQWLCRRVAELPPRAGRRIPRTDSRCESRRALFARPCQRTGH